MKNQFLLLLFVALSSGVFAQNLSGVVTDESAEVLIGANVLIKGTTVGTTTDLDGQFSLAYDGTYPITIEVSYTGFTNQEIELTQAANNLTIELVEGLLIGQEVVVSASRKREKIQEAPASISVLSARKLAGSPQVDPVRNLVNVAGVQIQQQSAARFNIEMRGGIGLFDTNTFPIMDYRSLVGPGIGTFQSDQSGISRIDIDRIEVVRGPGSALYGPGVTTGVVHFITKNPIDHPGTTLEVGGGELNTFISAVRHAGRNASKTFGYKINATYNRGDEFTLDPEEDADQISLFKTEITDPVINNELVDLAQPGRTLLTREDLDPDGDGNMMQDHYWNAAINTTLEFRPQNDLSFTLSGGMNTGSSVYYNDLGEGLAQALEFWTQARVQKGGLFAQLFYVNNNGGNDENPTFLYQSGLRSSLARDQIEGQIQYNFQTPSFLNADWTVGVDYREAVSDTKNLVYGRQEDEDDYRIFGGYLQGKFPLGDKFDLYAAARYDNVSFTDEGAFSPRVAAVYKPDPKHTFRASFNRAVNLPTALDVYIDFPLNVPVPGLFDVWYAGMFEPHEFAETPMIDVTLPGVPDLPFGTPGLPLSVPFQAVNADVLAGIEPAIAANPQLAIVAEPILEFLRNYTPAGFTGQLVGVNVFSGEPFSELNRTTGPNLRIENTFEVGYKGLIGEKLGVTADLYHIRTEGARSFAPVAPVMTLQGANIAEDLGATVGNDFNTFFIDLLTPIVGADMAVGFATQVTPLVVGAYQQGGQTFVDQVPAPLLSDIFGAVETSRMPMNDGITHVPVGLRALEDATSNRWGLDLSTEYHFNTELSAWANYSWVGDIESRADDSETTQAALSSLGNTPRHKYRLGLVYTPLSGIRANVSFQHNDGFTSRAGQFSGIVPATNLVDASVGYQMDNGLAFDLTATNLFDSEYRALPNMPKIGRRVVAKVTYNFGEDK
ncbi:MAG: TonB-dependent receptor [Bacteroidota bacterium]